MVHSENNEDGTVAFLTGKPAMPPSALTIFIGYPNAICDA